jgi:hypothetical protein
MQFIANQEFRPNGSIIRHDSCNYSKEQKEKLEQQVARPACSNTSNQNQSLQQQRMLLNG